MPRTRAPYPGEYRDHIVMLAHSGRSAESPAREFEPCAATIHDWVKQSGDGEPVTAEITSTEREELRRLRWEVRQLRQERDLLSKAAAWFAQNEVTSKRSSNS